MSSTNKTLTIELSQYVGTDKPTYLTDYNGDMLKIDNAIAADRDSITTAQGKADGADAKADANATAIQTLDGQINNTSNGLTKRVTDVEGDVNTIESLIGNGTPTTTDKTIIGAINELDTIKLDIADLTASKVPVSSISGMSATDVQAALAELEDNIVDVTVKTGTVTDTTTASGNLATNLPATTNILMASGWSGANAIIALPYVTDQNKISFHCIDYAGAELTSASVEITYRYL